jgi:Flp pilus assembly protein TadB
MDQIISQPSNPGVKKPRTGRHNRKTKEPDMTVIDKTQARLDTHELLCIERYKAIETRMDSIESRVDSISADVKELKQTNDKQFSEIKTMLTAGKDEKFKTMVTVAGTIIVALLGVMSYLITHLPN